jgi:hypothetical protein
MAVFAVLARGRASMDPWIPKRSARFLRILEGAICRGERATASVRWRRLSMEKEIPLRVSGGR